MRLKFRLLAALLAACAFAPPALAAATFEYLFDHGYPLSISWDGTKIAGNTVGAYDPFRWTRTGGFVNLGMGAAGTVGVSAGKPGISANGSRVAATICGPDSTYYTQGLWTEGSGWQTLVPPIPPGFNVVDYGLASVDGLSGDGTTVIGLIWGYRANAAAWTQATGLVPLGASTGRSSRAMGVNYDGSVIVGFDESTQFGYRTPAVWLNGQRTNLAPHIIGEVWCSTLDGQTIGGFQRDSTNNTRAAALWRRVGNGWSATQHLNLVPGTDLNSGINGIRALSADGRLAVGYCSFGGDPFFTTGFVWTDSTGAIDVVQFLAMNGVLPDPAFEIRDLTCMTPDGTKIVGFGRDTSPPNTVRAFMIHLDRHLVAVEGDGPGSRLEMAAAPNPVHAQTTLSFTLMREESGALTVHDSAGRLVRRLLHGAIAAGPHSVRWDGRDENGAKVAPGVYFTNLVAGSSRESKKLVVVN